MRTVPGATERIVIVGAGLAGLSAALRLAGTGREVTVVERAAVPGGRMGRLDVGGYQFDTGPSVLTMPDLIADALDCVGESLDDWLDLAPVSPLYRAYFPDGSRLDVLADPDAMSAEIERVCGPSKVAGYRRFVAFVRELYRLQMRDFIDRNLDSPIDLVNARLARLIAIGGFRRLAPTVASYLHDPRLQRIFSFQAMYAGLSPYEALAIYAVISYMDSVAGVFFPRGGMHAVALALAGAAAKHGVNFRYDTDVSSIRVHNGRATGVLTADGDLIAADVIIANPDLPVAYRELLPAASQPRRIGRLRYSPSCFLMHTGSSATYSQAAHHNIHFGRSWRGVFRELIDKQELMSDPSILVTNPTRTDASLAPAGRQIYSVLAPAPHAGSGIDWTIIGPRYRDEVMAILEARGYVGFAAATEVEQVVTPADWQAAGLAMGSPFAAAHTFWQTGPFRPANLAPGLDNVIFAGSGTQPGVGVPMVLISGRLAAERVTGADRTYRSRAQR